MASATPPPPIHTCISCSAEPVLTSHHLPPHHQSHRTGTRHDPETPLPLSVRSGRRFDADLENIVQMALRKEPERRYATMDQFSEDVRLCLSGYPVVARPPPPGYRLRKFTGRNTESLTAAVVAVLGLIGA